MKRIPATFVLFLFAFSASSQFSDSALKQLASGLDRLPVRMQRFENTLSNDSLTKRQLKCASASPVHLTTWQHVLVFSPIVLFLISLGYLYARLRHEEFKLSRALSTFRPKTTKMVSKTFAKDGTVASCTQQEKTEDELVRSASRMLAFFSVIVALIIAVMLTCFIAYQAFSHEDIKYSELWKILAALSIGILPYATNVFRGNQKEQRGHTNTSEK
jgi:hypothetical protein